VAGRRAGAYFLTSYDGVSRDTRFPVLNAAKREETFTLSLATCHISQLSGFTGGAREQVAPLGSRAVILTQWFSKNFCPKDHLLKKMSDGPLCLLAPHQQLVESVLHKRPVNSKGMFY